MANIGLVQVRFTSTQGISSDIHGHSTTDNNPGSFLWFPLRTVMHDAVCTHFSDTRPYTPPPRFRRSQIQFVRGEPRYAHFAKDLRARVS
jgi:hypothetical protein